MSSAPQETASSTLPLASWWVSYTLPVQAQAVSKSQNWRIQARGPASGL